MRRSLSFLSQNFPWLLLVFSLFPLAVWACLGFFVRYLADDYSTSYQLARSGFWQAQAFWYQSWSGRYSFTFLVSLVELLGVKIVPWLPFVALSAWYLSLFWALKQVFKALSIPVEKKWIGILAAVIIFGVVKSTRNYTEVVFWQTGILTYQISNILFALLLGLFLKRFFAAWNKPALALWEYFFAFFIAFIAGGFSETWIVVQLALLTVAILSFALFYKGQNRNDILKILLTAYIASWCSFILIVKAPGNLGRTAHFSVITLQSIAAALVASIGDVPGFALQWVQDNTFLVIVLTLTGIVSGFFAAHPTDLKKAVTHLKSGLYWSVTACALLAAGFFPAFVVWGIRPVDRAIFIPLFIFIAASLLLGFFFGRFLSAYFKYENARIYLQGFALLVLVLGMGMMQVRVAFSELRLFSALQTYARLWDERDAFLRQASGNKKGNIVVPSLRRNPAFHDIQGTIWMTGELSENRKVWINRAAALYYGVQSISGK